MGASVSDTSRAFDQHARAYDGIVEPNELLHAMRAVLWAEVEYRVPPPAQLLDIGCGTGIDAAYFARRGYIVTGIDRSSEMVNVARQRTARQNLSKQVRIENIGAARSIRIWVR
jgi:2-polyprenyl-3-methyl-5-hydroxy-6-metoxy-1,4-benzoquinol methylase